MLKDAHEIRQAGSGSRMPGFSHQLNYCNDKASVSLVEGSTVIKSTAVLCASGIVIVVGQPSNVLETGKAFYWNVKVIVNC